MSVSKALGALALLALASACVPPPRTPPPSSAKPNFIPAPPRTAVPRPVPPRIVAPPRPQLDPEASGRLTPPPALFPALRSLAEGFNGKVGIAVMRTDGNWLFGHLAETHFPQQSVSKLWVALTVLDGVDAGKIKLDQNVLVTRDDLTLFNQPIAQLVGDDGYQTTVSDLLSRAMTKSDNTANDRLLKLVGGPEKVRATLATKGLGNIRFGPGERALQSKAAGLVWQQSYATGNAFKAARAKLTEEARLKALNNYLETLPDGATPQGIVTALARLKRGELLSERSTRLMLSLMDEAITGHKRVRGGVPFGWQYGHKTGTGQELAGRSTGYNDVGIMTAPDGVSYVIAVMIAETRVGIPTRQAMMQGVSAAIAANHQR
ncbi:MAG: serine hydrolase [Sphingomonadaceae bacterium]